MFSKYSKENFVCNGENIFYMPATGCCLLFSFYFIFYHVNKIEELTRGDECLGYQFHYQLNTNVIKRSGDGDGSSSSRRRRRSSSSKAKSLFSVPTFDDYIFWFQIKASINNVLSQD
jgi:hypothetical protein